MTGIEFDALKAKTNQRAKKDDSLAIAAATETPFTEMALESSLASRSASWRPQQHSQ